jgi:hypothetical protein
MEGLSPDPPIGWLGGVDRVRRGVAAVREAAGACDERSRAVFDASAEASRDVGGQR